MSDVKEIVVSVDPIVETTLKSGKIRRKRNTTKINASHEIVREETTQKTETHNSVPQTTSSSKTPTTVVKTPATHSAPVTHSATVVKTPATHSATVVKTPAAHSVLATIPAKTPFKPSPNPMVSETHNTTVSIKRKPKIIPTKKQTPVTTPQTRKKPKIVIPTKTKQEPVRSLETVSTPDSSALKGKKHNLQEGPVHSGGKTRKFRERRISISVEPSTKSKKTLKSKVSDMPINRVRRTLISKGLISDSNKQIPDKMMRSMLVDYISLH